MTTQILNQWIMHHEIQRLHLMGFSNAKIASYLVIDSRTVKRHLQMSDDEFEQYLISTSTRKRQLAIYEEFTKKKLIEYPDTSAAQIHDWLKEWHPDFPTVTSRTVYNFVMHIRQVHNIPYVRPTREFFPVADMPLGKQAQVDFGVYNMRLSDGKRKKVYFFAMVMSSSRMKYVWFWDRPFTSQMVVEVHEKAFGFYEGIPETVVYDQDRTIIVDENLGDIVLTSAFDKYSKARKFNLHFCRKSDPQSKGKIENVIQYVKKNFLYNRVYSDIETLNAEAFAWLGRTANSLPHNYTKESPDFLFSSEKKYLKPFIKIAMPEEKIMKTYKVRKNNAIAYKSNFYTVPIGTYKDGTTVVLVDEKEAILQIYNTNKEHICSHEVYDGKGKTIRNTHHARDNSKRLGEIISQVVTCFSDTQSAEKYLQQIKEKYPRYTRDHCQVILKALKTSTSGIADKTLAFCIKNELLNGYEFEQALLVLIDDKSIEKPFNPIKLMDKNNAEKANQTPQVSNIEEYENIMNQ